MRESGSLNRGMITYVMFSISCNKKGNKLGKDASNPMKLMCFSGEIIETQNHYAFCSFRAMGASVLKSHLHVISNTALIDLHPNWIILQQKRWASFVCLWAKGIVMVKCPSSSCSVLVIYPENCWVFSLSLRREEKLMTELHNEFLLACSSSKHTSCRLPAVYPGKSISK